MNVLVINCGSSTVKADVVDPASGARAATARVERVGGQAATVRFDGGEPVPVPGRTHAEALEAVLPRLLAAVGDGEEVAGVGHRVVHGGERFVAPTRVDEEVEAAIEALIPLAPLHNPANLAGIRAARGLLPGVPHVAVFDTAFHATLPRRARTYALPERLRERLPAARRFGFHGTSHAWIASRVAEHLGADVRDLRVITCHLGNGASVAAVEYGRSVETSMGMTPLEGLVMGTRSGDVDPGLLLALQRDAGLSAEELDAALNREAGLLGLSGASRDMRDLERLAAEGHDGARLAIHAFTHRVRKYIGAYAAVMGGVDAIAVSAGIGEHSALVRHRVFQRLGFLGARLDEERNRAATVSREAPVTVVSDATSRVPLCVVATDEEHAIAREVFRLVGEQDRVRGEGGAIPVAVSARHVHLTDEAVEALFGAGHTLTVRKPISQPGQFVAEERVTLVGPKRRLERVAVVGPTRRACQVEISRTDEFALGLDAPVRDSGDIGNSPGILLEGPAGRLELGEGVICARRHIHMTPEDARRFRVSDRDVVEVALDTDGRDLVFGDVLVRVSPKYKLEMHIDTDEANAAELTTGEEGVLVTLGPCAQLRRRDVRFDRVG